MDIKLPPEGCCKTNDPRIIDFINDLKDHKYDYFVTNKDVIAWNYNSCWFAKNSSKPEYSEEYILNIIERSSYKSKNKNVIINKLKTFFMPMHYTKKEILEILIEKTKSSISKLEDKMKQEESNLESKVKEIEISKKCLAMQYEKLFSIENLSKSESEGLEKLSDNILKEMDRIEKATWECDGKICWLRTNYKENYDLNIESIGLLKYRLEKLMKNETANISA